MRHRAFPHSLGHFKLIGCGPIGKGSNSVVYEGVNTITKEPVSIKIVPLLNHIIRDLIEKETNFLRENYHPNILRFHHHFYIDNTSYLVTQLCQETLSSRIKRSGRLQEGEAITIFLKILRGYELMRRKGYIHRDLKPDNIFMKDGHPKIGDFQYNTKLRCEEVKESFNLGTPLYMSPQSLLHNVYSEKSDVWSLGLILYEMLHGKSPFRSKCERELIKEIRQPVFKIDCNPQLAEILKKSLALRADQRLSLGQLKSMVSQCISIRMPKRNVIKQEKSTKMSDSQANYVRFMEYIKTLASKCKRNVEKDRILFVFQYNIRMRLHLYSSVLANGRAILTKEQLDKLKEKHQYQLQWPSGLSQSDRLHFFDPKQTQFTQSLLWQTQAELKQILKSLLKQLSDISSQEKVARCEDEIRLVDFLLTAFVLNKMVIEGENNMQRFHQFSYLDIIINHPQRFNLEVLMLIRQKALDLKII